MSAITLVIIIRQSNANVDRPGGCERIAYTGDTVTIYTTTVLESRGLFEQTYSVERCAVETAVHLRGA